MTAPTRPAPPIAADQWFNTDTPPTLEALRGRVVVIEAFQMLCPGCVSHGLPQAGRIASTFAPDKVAVIGLHSVFEHHEAMTPAALRAFLHEYRLRSPVGVDLAEEGSDIPVTMRRFGLRGTPSSVLIGRDGAILHHAFGVEEDLALGARIAMALSAPATELRSGSAEAEGCGAGRCEAPAMTGAT